jgi:gluconate 2-dehydrogenase gamma chain
MSPKDKGNQSTPTPESDADNALRLSRRNFLKMATITAAATAVGCQTTPPPATPNRDLIPQRLPLANQYPEVPYTPTDAPPPILRFFTPHEAETVEAFAARLLPGTPEDPGAREAGVLYYIDALMAFQEGFAESVYREPPFAESYEGASPPQRLSNHEVIWIPADEIARYGYQSQYTPRDELRLGLASLDRFANEQHDADFIELSEEQQDGLIQMIVDGEATSFSPISGESFFHAMRRYTNEGMFSDPVYGGNRNMVGWALINYPGAQRAYTVNDIIVEGEAANRPRWSIADMPHFHPGEPVGPNTVLPVTGSEERRQHFQGHGNHD